MSNKLKTVLLLICTALCITLFSSCLGPGDKPSEDTWTPTGKEITLLTAGETSEYTVLFAGEDEVAKAAASDFKDLLLKDNIRTTGMVISDGVSNQKKEILFGAADRDVSKKAKELLDEKVASENADLNCVFYYYDEKLAIIADSEMAYEMALSEFSARYIKSGKVSFKDTLCECISYSSEDYLDRKLEIFLASSEETKAEHEDALDDLLDKLAAQRDDLTASGFFGSSTKNIGASKWGTAPATPTDEHPRLFINKSTLPDVMRTLMLPGDKTSARILSFFDMTVTDDAILPPSRFEGTNSTVNKDNVHNFDEGILEKIQIKALAYLVTGDSYYGYEAILYIKNYIKSLDIVQIASDQCRQYGAVMYTAAIVYDWCYPLLTDVDKEQIIAGVENRICRYKNQIGAAMEVGFPPSGQSVIVGHGAERQILRDYFAFATAIYGDNSSWWDFIAARVCNSFVPPRNFYYKSGIIHQGTSYVKGRYISDLFSAWIMSVATGVDLYDGLAEVTKGVLGLEMASGIAFNSGDDTGDSAPLTDYMQIAYITAYLEKDPVLLAQAHHLHSGAAFTTNFNYMNSVLFTALRGLADVEPAENRYEGMELIQYNGYPLGQYVIRQAWNSTDTASVMMRIKEVYPANHDHHDAGTFEIYYKGALTTDGGVYNNYGHAHTAYFHKATISHNGLLIFNPTKWDYNSKTAATKWYSGGQKTMSTPTSVDNWTSGNLDTGKVTGRQHAYSDADKQNPLYAYIAGDITKAYDEETVNYVGRRMLTVYTGDEDYPMVFFVYDDITSDKKTFKKTFLLQISSDVAPTINAEDQTVTTEHDNGRLVLTCLSDDVKIEGIGGRNEGKFSAKASQNYMVNGYQLSPQSNTADDKHWGRVEISNAKETDTVSFLNVIYVTDKGNDKAVNVRKTSSNDGLTGGIYDKKIAALFVTSRERAEDTVSCKTYGTGSMSYYVSGVAEGSWSVSVDGTEIGTYEASAEGGLLTFNAPAGKVEISPVK